MNYLDFCSGIFVLVPFAALFVNNIFPKKLMERYFWLLSGVVAVLQMLAAVLAFFVFDAQNITRYDFSLFLTLGSTGKALFRLTPVSLLFLFCIGMVSFVSVMIAKKTIDMKKSTYVNLLMTLIIGMNGMVLVKDLFSLYVFLDVIGISSFVMIAMFRSRKALEGSIKYLIISELATVFILTGLAFIFFKTGSLSYDQIGGALLKGAVDPQKIMVYAALVLMIAGFSVKAGVVPFHSWLPDAHQSADTAISVLLSGIVIKTAGIYGLVVLTRLFPNALVVQVSLMVIGLLSIVVGALLALRQDHFKRIVAYSSVSQMGYILLGLSTGTTLGLIGAVVHVFSHAVFKSTLFTNAAAVHEQTGTLQIDELGGLQSRMPVTAFSSIIAFLSTAGIPPFIGFWSKLMIILALWLAGYPVLAGCALCASIFTGAYLLRLQKKVFFGKTPEGLQTVKEIKGSVCTVEVLLTIVTSAAGILFPLALVYLQHKGYL